MFDSLINRAQHSVESAVLRYVARIAVAIPFLIAFGFGIAAASAKLTEMYGQITAHAIIAGVFAAVGVIAAAAIAMFSPSSSVTENYNNEAQAAALKNEGAPQPSLLDSDLLVATLGVVGPKMIPAIPALMRMLVKNWSLVTSLIIVSYLLFSDKSTSALEQGKTTAQAGE